MRNLLTLLPLLLCINCSSSQAVVQQPRPVHLTPVIPSPTFRVDLPDGWLNVTSSVPNIDFAAIQVDSEAKTAYAVSFSEPLEKNGPWSNVCANPAVEMKLVEIARQSERDASAREYEMSLSRAETINGRPATVVELTDRKVGTATFVFACGQTTLYVGNCNGGIGYDTIDACAEIINATHFE